MAIFNKKIVVDTAHFLNKETEGIVNVFTKALNDLNNINSKAQVQMEAKAIQI